VRLDRRPDLGGSALSVSEVERSMLARAAPAIPER
jgi:hypothetical protein